MRQIAVTFPYFFEGEDTAIRRLIDSGWFRVHIRKPDATKDDVAGLLCKLPQNYRHAISLHDHFQLAEEFGLGGIHLNGRNPEIPADWRGLVSRSCHSLEEHRQWKSLDYLFLSPVFDSISKKGYKSAFCLDELAGEPLENVFALGGVTPERFPLLEDAGFGGAAMLSAAWEQLQLIKTTKQ